MSKLAKALTAAAGNAAGESLYVEDVFSTYLYEGGNGSGTNQAVNVVNDVNLNEEGGLIWLKRRDVGNSHALIDTERGRTQWLNTDTTSAAISATGIDSFNTDGFTVSSTGYGETNNTSGTYASWTFRKAEKFFDVVTWQGTDGGGDKVISHSLGVKPACMIIRRYSSTDNWSVYHKDLFGGEIGATGTGMYLNSTSAAFSMNNEVKAVTDSDFTVGTTHNGHSSYYYVAYLFASDAGGFGDDGSESIIKCGSYTTDANEDATINLGWEPQWLLVKRTDSSTAGDWRVIDSMRGWEAGGDAAYVEANTSDAEAQTGDGRYYLTSTGFKQDNFGANRDYIYIAIRRPMKTPESGTEVFDLGENRTSIGNQTIGTLGAIDMCMSTQVPTPFTNYHWAFTNRLVGGDKFLASAYTQAEATAYQAYDTNTGVINGSWFTNGGLWYNFKRATGFFDVVAYTGTGVAGRTVAHNLGVAPELIIVKHRTLILGDPAFNQEWSVYSSELNQESYLNETTQFFSGSSYPSAPTSSEFTVGIGSKVNHSGVSFIAYLFASVAGVSKVGSYTGNGTSQTIDCGFSNGARFILIKSTSTTGSWWVYDSARGIVAGNDPALQLNSTAAEVTSADAIDPDSSGFIVNQEATCSINASGVSYIFMSIA